jgi:hypothetical protein
MKEKKHLRLRPLSTTATVSYSGVLWTRLIVCAPAYPQKNTMGGDLHMMECMNEEIVTVNES